MMMMMMIIIIIIIITIINKKTSVLCKMFSPNNKFLEDVKLTILRSNKPPLTVPEAKDESPKPFQLNDETECFIKCFSSNQMFLISFLRCPKYWIKYSVFFPYANRGSTRILTFDLKISIRTLVHTALLAFFFFNLFILF